MCPAIFSSFEVSAITAPNNFCKILITHLWAHLTPSAKAVWKLRFWRDLLEQRWFGILETAFLQRLPMLPINIIGPDIRTGLT
jgi:hypothetical protein